MGSALCKSHCIDKLETSRTNLLRYIIKIIPEILERDDAQVNNDDYDARVNEYQDLLISINDEFNSSLNPSSNAFQFTEAIFYINMMSSSEQAVDVAESLFALFSLDDSFVKEQFISIIQHLLVSTDMTPYKDFSIKDTAIHLMEKSISDDAIRDFFDLFYRLVDVSDPDRDIVNKLVNLSNTDPSMFSRIHDMLTGFNPRKKRNQ